jgi:hypothetical protein
VKLRKQLDEQRMAVILTRPDEIRIWPSEDPSHEAEQAESRQGALGEAANTPQDGRGSVVSVAI